MTSQESFIKTQVTSDELSGGNLTLHPVSGGTPDRQTQDIFFLAIFLLKSEAMIEKWYVKEPASGKIKRAIVCLAGRDNPPDTLMRVGLQLSLPDTLIVSVSPRNMEWYPMPVSAVNQSKAVKGLPSAIKATETLMRRVTKGFGLASKDIVLMGYSAGGVVSLQSCLHMKRFHPGAIIVLCGACLEPEKVPSYKNHSPIMLVHNQDDQCFEWEERYLPMKEALVKNNHDVQFVEKRYGGHMVQWEDLLPISDFIAEKLGIEGWEHPDKELIENTKRGK